MRVSSLSLALLVIAGGTTAAMAQGRPQPTAQQRAPGDHLPPPDARGPAPSDPAEAKQQLQRRLEELERHEATLREAIKKIEQGVPVAEAMRGLAPERRPEGRPGEARPDGRRMEGERPQGEGERREGDRRLDRPVTEEEKQHTRAFLRQHLPGVADKFEALEKVNPEMAERGLRRMVLRVQEAEDARESDPMLFNLKVAELEGSVNMVEAIRGYREAESTKDAAKIQGASEDLRKAVARQVETRLKLQAHEIEGLTKRVEELKADLAKKDAEKSVEIDRMVKRIQDFPQRAREPGREGGPPSSGPAPKPAPK